MLYNIIKIIKRLPLILFIIISILFIKLKSDYNKLDLKYVDAINNTKHYENLFSNEKNNNRVLQLTVDELNNSKDSVIKSMTKTIKEQELKIKNLDTFIKTKSEINDTSKVKIDTSKVIDNTNNPCDFIVEITPNNQTFIKVSRINDELEQIMRIYNEQDVIITDCKEWRNPNKNFFKRLFTWDWKKDKHQECIVINSNDIIKVTETRVVKNNKKNK